MTHFWYMQNFLWLVAFTQDTPFIIPQFNFYVAMWHLLFTLAVFLRREFLSLDTIFSPRFLFLPNEQTTITNSTWIPLPIFPRFLPFPARCDGKAEIYALHAKPESSGSFPEVRLSFPVCRSSLWRCKQKQQRCRASAERHSGKKSCVH